MANYKFGEYIKPAIVEFYTKYNAIIDKILAAHNSIPTFSITTYPDGPYSDPNDPRYRKSDFENNFVENIFKDPYSLSTIRISTKKIWLDQFKFGERRGHNTFVEISDDSFTTVDVHDPESFFNDAVWRIAKNLCPYFYNHEKKLHELSETEWFNVYPIHKEDYGGGAARNYVEQIGPDIDLCWTWKALCEKYGIPLREDFNSDDYYLNYFPFNWPISYHVLANKLIEMLDSFQYIFVYGNRPFVCVDVETGKSISGDNNGDTIFVDDTHYYFKNTISYADDYWDIKETYNNLNRDKKLEVQSGIIEVGDHDAYVEAYRNFLEKYDELLLSIYDTSYVKEYEIYVQQTATLPGWYGFFDVRSSASHYYIPEQADRHMSKSYKRIYDFSGRSYTGTYTIERSKTYNGNGGETTETYETKTISIPASGYAEPYKDEYPEELPPFEIDEGAIWFSNSYYMYERGDLYYGSIDDPNDATFFLSIQKI